jgi:6-phosphofructokinase 1
LHSTAHSHHRIIIAEVMGHRAGWLALGAGIAGGADVILLPEIPYDVRDIAAAIRRRKSHGSSFSIVAVAEGAVSKDDAVEFESGARRKANAKTDAERQRAKTELTELAARHAGNTLRLSKQLEELTRLEARVTILGYLQRGGTPSAGDRLLATRLGTMCVELINDNVFGVMVAARGDSAKPVPIAEVAGRLKLVPPDHPWIESARRMGTSLGD